MSSKSVLNFVEGIYDVSAQQLSEKYHQGCKGVSRKGPNTISKGTPSAADVMRMDCESQKLMPFDAADVFQAYSTLYSRGIARVVTMDDPNITKEEYIRLEEEKARRCGKVFNWETAMYAALSCESMGSSLNNDEIDLEYRLTNLTMKIARYFDDLDFFKDFENEFPAIVYNDAQTFKSESLTEPILNPQHIDEFNLKDETSLSKCDEEELNVLNFNDLFPFNVIYPNDSKLDKYNDDDKVDIEHSSGDLSVKSLPDVINTDVGAYAHGSNKLLETRPREGNINEYWWRIYESRNLEVLES
ncbi:hypothetical protein Tco_0424266 [Tanacetum coccineum]